MVPPSGSQMTLHLMYGNKHVCTLRKNVLSSRTFCAVYGSFGKTEFLKRILEVTFGALNLFMFNNLYFL